MASITLDHIGKNYTPEVTVIRDLSFDIKDCLLYTSRCV